MKLGLVGFACGHDGLHQNLTDMLGTILNNRVQALLKLLFFLLAKVKTGHARIQVGELRLVFRRFVGKA